MDAADALRILLREYSIAPESEAAGRLSQYLALLQKWNARVNLTSSTEWNVLGPMFREGIWAAKRYPEGAASHLDIGSGAGFPALLLKILHPHLHLELVESRGKKSLFLETAVHQLDLTQVQVHNARLSDCLRRQPPEAYWDCISWKGLKIGAGDLLQLRRHAKEHTEFWLFHGLELPWEESDEIHRRFSLLRKEKIPGMREWSLSIYTTH
jgi:16S rRNA (guanine(527)-N(7))-methyltransferase RsmG